MKTGCIIGCNTLQHFNDGDSSSSDSDSEERDWYAARIAANAYFDLSQEDKDRADGDLYGTEEPIEETPEFVEGKLEELDRELSRLSEHTRKYYVKALNIEQELLQAGGEDYVGSPQFRLMFLRADLFDARLAARRLSIHFKEKYDLFGEEVLARKIRYLDFNEKEKEVLVSGGMIYTGAADEAGRPIVVARRCNLLRFPTTCLKRVSFYFFQTIMEGNHVAQKKGLVGLGYNLGESLQDPLAARRLFPLVHMLTNGLPFRFSGYHNMYDDQYEHLIINLVLVVVPKQMRTRFVAHYITRPEELLYKTLRYGINLDDLPIEDYGFRPGDLKYEMIRNYWEQQWQTESIM